MLNTAVCEPVENYDAASPDYDGLWKKVIAQLFEEFIMFVAPELYEAIDFSRDPEFLQQELFKNVIRGKKGKRVADQIVKVYLKNGEEKWVLIHVEVQGDGLKNFQRRMFQYFYRIYDKYERQVCAIGFITSEAGDKPVTRSATHFSERNFSINTMSLHLPSRIQKPWNVPETLLPWQCWQGFTPTRRKMMCKNGTGLNENCCAGF